MKRATREDSRPNQVAPEMEWNAGTVSRMVTRAEKAMREVMEKWTRKAAEEDDSD